MSGALYLAGALPLGGRFVWFAWRLRRDVRLAMPTFRYSIVYLFGLFAVLLADHYVAASLLGPGG
jgi:protoheme IX farnesyltransferase